MTENKCKECGQDLPKDKYDGRFDRYEIYEDYGYLYFADGDNISNAPEMLRFFGFEFSDGSIKNDYRPVYNDYQHGRRHADRLDTSLERVDIIRPVAVLFERRDKK